MQRIYACLVVTGLFGFGLMHSAAQTDTAPALLKPANAANPKNPTTEPKGPALAPEAIDPYLPPMVEPVSPPSQKSEPAVLVFPPVEPDLKPAPQTVKPPAIPLPPADPMTRLKSTDPSPMIDAPIEPTKAPVRVEVETPRQEPVNPNALAVPAGNRVSPIVSIETIAPAATPYGQPITYEIVVKNTGLVPVMHVRVDEEISAGAKFVGAEPAGEINGDKVMWMLGSLSAGEAKRIRMSVKPGNDGDLRTKPRVSFSVATAMHVRITRPNIVVAISGPENALIGDEAPLRIQVSNNGTGEAVKVTLKAVLSDGLKHPEGYDIQAVLNNLAPGQSQTVTLRVQAAQPGQQQCSVVASCEGAAKTTAQAKVNVRQPKLNLALAGPAKCVVRTEPLFTLEIANPGSSATGPVQLAAAFPEGLDFVIASDGGAYDLATRTVSWNLGPAPAGSKRHLTIKTKSSMAGNLAVRAVAQAGPRLNARAETIIQAEGVPALMFEVVELEDPIEVGKETTYEIRVANTGSMHCTNVRLMAALSDGLAIGKITANVPHMVAGQSVVFEPFARLPVKGNLVIRVKAKGMAPGDHRFKVQLSCDQLKQPVVKEESTSFFQP